MDDARTIYCGNLSSKVTEELLYELFLQAGPLEDVILPKDPKGEQKSFAFIVYKHECSIDYALRLYQYTTLFDRRIDLKPRNRGNQVEPGQGRLNTQPHNQTNGLQTPVPHSNQASQGQFYPLPVQMQGHSLYQQPHCNPTPQGQFYPLPVQMQGYGLYQQPNPHFMFPNPSIMAFQPPVQNGPQKYYSGETTTRCNSKRTFRDDGTYYDDDRRGQKDEREDKNQKPYNDYHSRNSYDSNHRRDHREHRYHESSHNNQSSRGHYYDDRSRQSHYSRR